MKNGLVGGSATRLLACAMTLVGCSSDQQHAAVASDTTGGNGSAGAAGASRGGSAAGGSAAGGSAAGGGASGGAASSPTVAGGSTGRGGSSGAPADQGGAGMSTGGTVAAGGGGASGGAAPNGGASGYSTKFDLTENPISESGAWTTGKDSFQSAVRTSDGLAYGTQNGNEWETGKTYNDSDAYLSGFASQQRVTVTIHRAGTPVGDLEIEILLGWRLGAQRDSPVGPTHSDGIEISIGIGKFNQFLYVSRFLPESNKAAGDLSSALFNAVGDVQNGDVVTAELTLNSTAKTGTVHVTIRRGSKTSDLGSVTDATLYQVGQPGIGFFRQNNGTPDDPKMFCWADFAAANL